jgi:hypothetical protein
VNARIRHAVKTRGHVPTGQAALNCVYLAVMSLDPTGTGRKRWMTRWKPALNAFEIAFDGRLSPAASNSTQPELPRTFDNPLRCRPAPVVLGTMLPLSTAENLTVCG